MTKEFMYTIYHRPYTYSSVPYVVLHNAHKYVCGLCFIAFCTFWHIQTIWMKLKNENKRIRWKLLTMAIACSKLKWMLSTKSIRQTFVSITIHYSQLTAQSMHVCHFGVWCLIQIVKTTTRSVKNFLLFFSHPFQ